MAHALAWFILNEEVGNIGSNRLIKRWRQADGSCRLARVVFAELQNGAVLDAKGLAPVWPVLMPGTPRDNGSDLYSLAHVILQQCQRALAG